VELLTHRHVLGDEVFHRLSKVSQRGVDGRHGVGGSWHGASSTLRVVPGLEIVQVQVRRFTGLDSWNCSLSVRVSGEKVKARRNSPLNQKPLA
jgi:hypothetical protein